MEQFFTTIQNAFDWPVFKWVETNFWCPANDVFFKIITTLGNGGIIWILTALLLMCFKKYRKYGVMLICGLVIMLFTNNIVLKNLIARPRPYNTVGAPDWYSFRYIVAKETSYSFPSGHASSSILAVIPIWKAKYRWGIYALILALLICFSRVYIEIHFCSDILAAMFVGIIYGILGCILGKFLFDRFDDKLIGRIMPKKKSTAAVK